MSSIVLRLCLKLFVVAAYLSADSNRAAGETPSPPVRGFVPRSKSPLKIDGQLEAAEYQSTLATPVEYFHRDRANRPGQFCFTWDADAFYVGLRTLDAQPFSQEAPLWEGDAVEFYFDVRRGADFLGRTWPKGPHAEAVHSFFTGMHDGRLEPRFCLRPGFEQAIETKGIQTAARRTSVGLEVEYKLPWTSFPKFTPRAGEVIGLDAELSYSDGGPRSYRSFVFGSPLSVQQPANLARLQLVDDFEPKHWRESGPVLMPMRVDVPWSQSGQPEVVAQIASPPGRRAVVGRIALVVSDLRGNKLGEFEAGEEQPLAAEGDFYIREARWRADLAPAGAYQVRAVVFDKQGAELTRIAPRLVSVNSETGY